MTLTAPGTDVLPWDESQCTHDLVVPHSGKRGCKVDPYAAAVWNATCTQRFSWFMTALRREFDPRAQFAKANEVQLRGVMHLHVIVRSRADLVRARRRVAEIARSYGFGQQCDVIACDEGASWYLAKYAAKTADDRQWVPWPDTTGELRFGAPRMRAWSASRRWGLTMKALKRQQASWWESQPQHERDGGPADAAPAAQPAPRRLTADGTSPRRHGVLDSYTESYAGDPSAQGGGVPC